MLVPVRGGMAGCAHLSPARFGEGRIVLRWISGFRRGAFFQRRHGAALRSGIQNALRLAARRLNYFARRGGVQIYPPG